MNTKLKTQILFASIISLCVAFSACEKKQLVEDQLPKEEEPAPDLSSDDRKVVAGTWKQVARFASFGGKEVHFTPVESNKTLVFSEDGSFSVKSGALCYNGQTPVSLNGQFLIKNENIVFLKKSACSWDKVYFRVEGDDLFVHLPTCIESCGEQFKRVK